MGRSCERILPIRSGDCPRGAGMSVEGCAKLLEQADPARFRAAMTAPPEARANLFALYAFNVEISQAVWSSHEPLLCEIRLQYWADQVAAAYQNQAVDAHPVMTPLAEVIKAGGLCERDFKALIEARRGEVSSQVFEDEAALKSYLSATGGTLMAMAGKLLSMRDDYDGALRDYGAAAALAAFLLAVPELKARGRQPLPDESHAALRKLAGEALAAMDKARASRARSMGAAMPAFLTATEARPILKRVLRQPSLVLKGGLERPEFRRRLRAAYCQVFSRW